ncbi:diacylglycerol kinase family protein [Virgibacillus doumboii]|uniref:diacylglycerol kinase family protein n=1 Tax=Virgibacillus doumboii TaxID=2697503 RepID=UPI0031B5FC4A
MNDKKSKRSIGFSYAWNGLREVLKTEQNVKNHFMAVPFVIVAGVIFQIALVEWAVIILTIGFVIVTEMLNTAIERLIDYVKPEIHPLAGVIKDISAGAVLLSAIISVIVGLIIFLPELYELF